MKSLKMKLIYRKHKKAILGTLGAVLLAGLVFFFSYFHVTKVEVMGTSRYTDEQVKEMALQGAFTDNSVLAVLLHSRVDVEGVPFVEGFYIPGFLITVSASFFWKIVDSATAVVSTEFPLIGSFSPSITWLTSMPSKKGTSSSLVWELSIKIPFLSK